MKKGIIQEDIRFLLVDGVPEVGDFGEEYYIYFPKGAEVEVLRKFERESFLSGEGYVVFSLEDGESMAVDTSLVKIVEEE